MCDDLYNKMLVAIYVDTAEDDDLNADDKDPI